MPKGKKAAHNLIGSRTYQSWIQMRARCFRRSHHAWPSYGGRGVTVCERWETFENFLADMGERPTGTSLDRVNNQGHYAPDNCRWATPAEQTANTRTNHMLTFGGRTQHQSAWCREFGINWCTLRDRLKRGWPIERALTAPPRARAPLSDPRPAS